MAKISPASIKYMIYGKFKADGTVEKPDIIGALFGQTEGLLGSDLEMRDLQKGGKIGRIEVEAKKQNNKTVGEIKIPSSLDKTETTLIGAAVETIEKIGPSSAKISIEKIQDVRKDKRDYILKRAKNLLKDIKGGDLSSDEMTHDLVVNSRVGKIKKYGKEKLPAGNMEGDEIIVVEGRADVINLLKNGIDNVIGMKGTKLPDEIEKLSKNKEATLFVDGDRGGKLIAKNVIYNADIDFVAFAPDGKEVEELTSKEILYALRKKITADEFLKSKKGKARIAGGKKRSKSKNKKTVKKEKIDLEANKEDLKKVLKKAQKNKCLVLDKNLKIIGKSSRRGARSKLSKLGNKASVLVVEKATPGVVKAAEKNDVDIAAKNFTTSSKKVNLISL